MSTRVLRARWLAAQLSVVLFIAARLQAAPLMPPADALARMMKGGISLRAETRPIGPKGSPVLLHLWVVPTGRDPNAPVVPRDKNAPVKRDEITSGHSLKPSPFYLDVFAREGNRWNRINTVVFQESSDVQGVETRWLYPRVRRGPVVALRFTYDGHWKAWKLITFPQGLRCKPYVQHFLWGGEGGTGLHQRLDGTDARGVMQIEEEEHFHVNDKLEKHIYRWNGTKFVDPARYFLIGATTKTEDEAAAWVRRHKLKNAFVHWSDNFPLLRRGYAVVILGRYTSPGAAQKAQRAFRGRDFKPYVKRAF